MRLLGLESEPEPDPCSSDSASVPKDRKPSILGSLQLSPVERQRTDLAMNRGPVRHLSVHVPIRIVMLDRESPDRSGVAGIECGHQSAHTVPDGRVETG
jgi:hypothetical protein